MLCTEASSSFGFLRISALKNTSVEANTEEEEASVLRSKCELVVSASRDGMGPCG